MFLSRVAVPWEAARNPYDFHRQLWRLFPGEARENQKTDEEPKRGFLFRVEEHRPGKGARFLIQSHRKPEAAAGLVLVGTREFHPQPASGQPLSFVLTANPVKTIVDGERESKLGKKSEKCRVPLIKEDGQIAWLTRKLAGAASVEAATVLPHSPLYFRKGSHAGKLATFTFEGVVKIQDSVAFVCLLENGIGPAKAFGCGLMLVRRVF